MLTVLAIVGILLAAAIPAVTHLMKSGGLNVASREVANTLGLARQLAITQRVYARVVFPYSDLTAPLPTQYQKDMWYRTYAVMTNHDDTVDTGWTYASKWEYLPVGVVFLKDKLPAPTDPGSLEALNSWSTPYPSASDPSKSLAYIEFTPTGAAKNTATLTYQEGVMDASGNQTLTSTANAVTNVIDNLVGRIQVTRP
jgi:hypothetical protein